MINIEIPLNTPIILFFFVFILTIESDLQTQFAANRSNHTALTALIRLSFLFCLRAEAKLLCFIPIGKLVGTAIGATK